MASAPERLHGRELHIVSTSRIPAFPYARSIFKYFKTEMRLRPTLTASSLFRKLPPRVLVPMEALHDWGRRPQRLQHRQVGKDVKATPTRGDVYFY
jgi:hypothetical protein